MATIETRPVQQRIVRYPVSVVTLTLLGVSVLLSLLPMAVYPQPLFHYTIRGLAAVIIAACVGHILWRNRQLQQQLTAMQNELQELREHEATYVRRTRQIRAALHDLRSPISALQLSIDMLQRVSCEEDKRHLTRMGASLETAIEHVEYISAIQKGKDDGTLRQHLPQTEPDGATDDDGDDCGSRP